MCDYFELILAQNSDKTSEDDTTQQKKAGNESGLKYK